MPEDPLVVTAFRIIQRLLPRKLEIEQGAPLLYQVKVDNRLNFRPANPTAPTRGQSAFQTDLCVFERIATNVRIPRVVLEFKPGLSTHDILTYTTKARRHKQVYPYLRYGIVASKEPRITEKFFIHNEDLDFFLAAGSLSHARLRTFLRSILKKEVAASRCLEGMAFVSSNAILYRRDVSIEP